MTKEQELEIKNHLQALEKDAVIDLYLQKCFDTDVQLAEKDKEINFWKHKLTLLLNDPHIRIWTDVFDSEGNTIGERFFDTADKIAFMTNTLREKEEKDE